MKRMILKLTSLLFLLVIPVLAALADPPLDAPPPDPGGTGGGTPVGAPIDGGFLILLILGVAYGCYKLYLHYKQPATGSEPNQGSLR